MESMFMYRAMVYEHLSMTMLIMLVIISIPRSLMSLTLFIVPSGVNTLTENLVSYLVSMNCDCPQASK